MKSKTAKTGKMPWQGKMTPYNGNTKGGTGTTFTAAKGKGGSKHGGCGCGGKK